MQCVVDNFNANISSQNGLQSTHVHSILLTQPHKEQNDETTYIRRNGKEEMSQEILPDIPVQRYRGPSKPEMPYSVSTKSPLPLKVLARSGAKKLIGFFLKTVITEVGTPEYHGYNTKIHMSRVTQYFCNQSYIYPSSRYDSCGTRPMLTAMVEFQRLTNLTRQVYTIFTNDQ